jgi:hypothetical protein
MMGKTICEKCKKAKATLYSDVALLEPDVCGPCFRKITPVEVRMERAAQTTGMVRSEEADPDGIRKIHTDLLEIIRKNPGFTIVQLGAMAAMPRPTVTRLVTDLRKAGSPALAVSPTSTLDAALLAAKELAEENAQLKAKLARIQIVANQNQKELNRTRHLLEILRQESNEAEDELAEISWVCRKVGFPGSGEVVDQFQWLLSQLGYPGLVVAMAARRRAQARIREAEAEIERIEASMRIGDPGPQTGDRCLCGKEATKGESEEGFTICNDCFAEGEE